MQIAGKAWQQEPADDLRQTANPGKRFTPFPHRTAPDSHSDRHSLVEGRSKSFVDELDEVAARCITPGSVRTVGLSEPMTFSLQSVSHARTQALAAAEIAAIDPALNRRSRCSDLGPYRALLGADPLNDTALAQLDGAGSSTPMLVQCWRPISTWPGM